MIEIRNLEKSFGENVVLRGVNLRIGEGECVVIIGRSGCGKSVLLKHIIGLIKPDGGEILIGEKDIAKLEENELRDIRKKFGMVFQGSALFDSMNVLENVGIGLKEHLNLPDMKIREIVKEKLKLVGLDGIEDNRPAELSGGMKKRVALARAIAMDPECLLFDEPTTGLDPVMAETINKLIRELQKKLSVTAVAVTHDMLSAYEIADRIAMLHEGKIVFEGTPREVKACENPVVKEFISVWREVLA
ncbi:MAG: ABC transporter ATP-binding protein [Candidatus Eisenbacteria bacterium]|nr:ABC transporter ATP-binding protein [Candidatus Eisenbacteria bacterium]